MCKINHNVKKTLNEKERSRNELFFTNKHEALSFQENYVESGLIKKCFHAKIEEYPGLTPKFEPVCSESSYVFEKDIFKGCSEGCKFHQSIITGKFIKFYKVVRHKIRLCGLGLLKVLKWLLERFSALAKSVQIIIALALLFLVLGNSPMFYPFLQTLKVLIPNGKL